VPSHDDISCHGIDTDTMNEATSASGAVASAVDGGGQATQASFPLADDKPSSHRLTEEQLQPLHISMQVTALLLIVMIVMQAIIRLTASQDFLLAIKKVQPSAKREGFATTPNVSWDEVGALEHVRSIAQRVSIFCARHVTRALFRRELQLAITEPIKHPQRYAFFSKISTLCSCNQVSVTLAQVPKAWAAVPRRRALVHPPQASI
jgi:hypothetical protein